MSAKLKKRSWEEFSSKKESDKAQIVKGKTLLTESGDQSRLTFHLNNLLALFPDIDEPVGQLLLDSEKGIPTSQ